MKFLGLTVPVLAMFLLLAIPSLAAITCSGVISDLSPCLSYLVNGNGKPSQACCNGAAKLAAAASTVADRKAACSCLVSAAQSIKPNPSAAKALPRSCGLTLPFSIGPNIDCSKIS